MVDETVPEREPIEDGDDSALSSVARDTDATTAPVVDDDDGDEDEDDEEGDTDADGA